MLKYLADENFSAHIVKGLRRREPAIDITTIQELGLRELDDPSILAHAAQEGRILLTHDVSTMSDFAYERVESGLPMPGLFQIPRTAPVGQIIEDLILLAYCRL